MFEDDQDISAIREGIKSLCEKFPDKYWRGKDRSRNYPEEFVKALSDHGYLGCLIPEEYGGSGQKLRAAAIFWRKSIDPGEMEQHVTPRCTLWGHYYVMVLRNRKKSICQELPKEACGFRLLG